MKLKVFHEDEWREYPAKTYAEYTHEWLGEPHESVSVRLDGDGNETARNLVPDPQFRGDLSGALIRGEYEVSDGWVRLETAGVIPYFGVSIAVTPGQFAALRFAMRWGQGIGRFRIQFQFRNSSGGSVSNAQIAIDHSDMPHDGDMQFAYLVPNTATEVRAYVWLHQEGGWVQPEDGAHAFMSRWRFDTADTESAALAQVEHYFDGDTPPDRAWVDFQPRNISGVKRIWPRSETPPPPGVHYAWLGEPHESVSVRLDGDGNETARNHNSNGRFENGLSGWASFHGGGITVLDRGTMFEGLSDSNYVGHLSFSVTTGNTDNQGFYTSMSTPVEPGQFVALRSIMAVTGIGARDRQLVHWNMADGSTTYDSSYRTSTGAGIERKDVFQAPEGVESFQVRWHAQRNSAVGDFDFYATDMMFVVADSEESALAQVEHYFDGSTESGRAHDLWYNQDGVPHEWVNGTGWTPIH